MAFDPETRGLYNQARPRGLFDYVFWRRSWDDARLNLQATSIAACDATLILTEGHALLN